ncbi:MAG: hypothetical protein NTX03_09375 [Bacteroidetes bacterium]|nr:hypothetical protein [Bacteroidota bacterium]
MKNKLILIFLVAFTLNSCKKYEEGPTISFRTKTDRLVGEWVWAKIIEDSKEKTLSQDDLDNVWEFKKDNSSVITNPGKSTERYHWEFSDDAKSVFITFENSSLAIKMSILRLTNSEFWYTEQGSSSKTEIHLKSK